jgi:hypothetical protein
MVASFTNCSRRSTIQANRYDVYPQSALQSVTTSRAHEWLGQMPHIPEAPYNSSTKQHKPACLRDMCIDLLHEIYSWAEGRDKLCIFWLRGPPRARASQLQQVASHSERLLMRQWCWRRGQISGEHRSAAYAQQHLSASRCTTSGSTICSAPLWKLQEATLKLETYIVVIDPLGMCSSDSDSNRNRAAG